MKRYMPWIQKLVAEDLGRVVEMTEGQVEGEPHILNFAEKIGKIDFICTFMISQNLVVLEMRPGFLVAEENRAKLAELANEYNRTNLSKAVYENFSDSEEGKFIITTFMNTTNIRNYTSVDVGEEMSGKAISSHILAVYKNSLKNYVEQALPAFASIGCNFMEINLEYGEDDVFPEGVN